MNFIARGRNNCRKKFYTKIYTNFFPPCEKKLKSSSFARKTCVLGNILWIDQTLRRGLLYPFNYGSILYYPAWEYFVAALLVPPQAVGRTRNDLSCLYAEAYPVIPLEYFVAALLVPPQAVGRTRNDLFCLYAEASLIIPRGNTSPRLERSLFYNVSRKKATVFEGEV